MFGLIKLIMDNRYKGYTAKLRMGINFHVMRERLSPAVSSFINILQLRTSLCGGFMFRMVPSA